MFDVMHLGRLSPSAVPFAVLALVPVSAENVFAFLPPSFRIYELLLSHATPKNSQKKKLDISAEPSHIQKGRTL